MLDLFQARSNFEEHGATIEVSCIPPGHDFEDVGATVLMYNTGCHILVPNLFPVVLFLT